MCISRQQSSKPLSPLEFTGSRTGAAPPRYMADSNIESIRHHACVTACAAQELIELRPDHARPYNQWFVQE